MRSRSESRCLKTGLYSRARRILDSWSYRITSNPRLLPKEVRDPFDPLLYSFDVVITLGSL